MKRTVPLAAAVLAVAAMSLTACDPGPACADWQTQTVTGSHIVNGRVTPYVHTAQVCTRYEEGDK